MSFKEYFGIEGALLPRLASGFGAGIGQKGSVCGALTASVMAIGMKFGRTDPKDRQALSKVNERCRSFWERFEKEFGSSGCYNLIGYYLNNPEENEKWRKTGGRDKCAELVKKTAQMLCDFIKEP